MATLHVLEGRGVPARCEIRPRRIMSRRMRPVDGIVYGDVNEILGRSLLKKIKGIGKSAAKLAVAPVTTTYSVTKSAAKATVKAVKDPSLKNISAIVTKPATRAFNETKSNVREAGHMTAESARVTNTAVSRASGVVRRVAKRLIKTVAKKVLFKGDFLGADKPSVARISKNAAKGILMPVATAAVAANTTTAPAAPIVPVLVNEVIDELYSVLERNIKKGMSPKDAEKAAKEALDRLEPGEENDPKVSGGFMPLAIGAAAVLALIVVMRRRNR